MNSNITLQSLEEMTVDLDASFKFHCTQCGKCCENRDDIILSPMDIFRMSAELKMTPTEFSMQYCRVNIGPNSRMPIVTLQPVGANDRCPLLKNQKCSVHKVKPSVCALFPLGRYLAIEKEKFGKDSLAGSKVKYLLQPIDCGDDSDTHTVREWLSGFDIALEDEAYIVWNQVISDVSSQIQKLEKTQDMLTMMEVWFVARLLLYLRYDTRKDFLPQMQENVSYLTELLYDIPRLKEVLNNARRA